MLCFTLKFCLTLAGFFCAFLLFCPFAACALSVFSVEFDVLCGTGKILNETSETVFKSLIFPVRPGFSQRLQTVREVLKRNAEFSCRYKIPFRRCFPTPLFLTGEFFLCRGVGPLFNRLRDRKLDCFTVSRDCEAFFFLFGPLENVSLNLDGEEERVKNSERPWQRSDGDEQVWGGSFLWAENSTLILICAPEEPPCPNGERMVDLAVFSNFYYEFWFWRCVLWRLTGSVFRRSDNDRSFFSLGLSP